MTRVSVFVWNIASGQRVWLFGPSLSVDIHVRRVETNGEELLLMNRLSLGLPPVGRTSGLDGSLLSQPPLFSPGQRDVPFFSQWNSGADLRFYPRTSKFPS